MSDGGFLDWRQLYQAALDEVKDLVRDLPEGDQRNEVEDKVRGLDDMLARSDAQLAKQLNMHFVRLHVAAENHVMARARAGARMSKPTMRTPQRTATCDPSS